MIYWLNRIRDVKCKYRRDLQPPCSEDELAVLKRRSESELGATLPEGYCEFLRQTDGLAWNGVHIYGSRRAPLAGHEGGEVMGLIEENLEWREMLADIAEYEHLLVLGFSDLDHYVYDLRTGQYVVKAGGSSDVFARYKTFEELFEHAARLALGCPEPPAGQ